MSEPASETTITRNSKVQLALAASILGSTMAVVYFGATWKATIETTIRANQSTAQQLLASMESVKTALSLLAPSSELADIRRNLVQLESSQRPKTEIWSRWHERAAWRKFHELNPELKMPVVDDIPIEQPR